jgi:TPR repeat protein
MCLKNGLGVKQVYEKAVYWLKKAFEMSNIEAMLEYGTLLQEGIGIKQNLAEAAYWFLKAAEEGNENQ